MLLNSHISAYARCLAGEVCGLVRSTWGTSLGEDTLGTRERILHAKVARRACAARAPGMRCARTGQTFPLGHHGCSGTFCHAKCNAKKIACPPSVVYATLVYEWHLMTQGPKIFTMNAYGPFACPLLVRLSLEFL